MSKLICIVLAMFIICSCGRSTEVELPEGKQVQEYQYPPVYE